MRIVKWAAMAVIGLGVPAAAQERVEVVATVGMIADLAREVAGDCADIRALMGPGSDPHLYQPSASDIRALRGAHGIMHVGFGLEGQLGTVLEGLARGVPVLSVGPASIPAQELITNDGTYGVDPHLWMDVRLWSLTVPVLADYIEGLAPGCAGLAERADSLTDLMTSLHAWVGQAIAAIPDESRVLVTAHDAFAYFARAYEIDVVAIQGISTESEASIADIRQTAELVAERRVPAVFVESTISPRTIEALIEAVRNRGHEVSIGGQLYADAMGDAGTAAGTYVGMIVENTLTIARSLGGNAPPLPGQVDAWLAARDLAVETQ